MDIKKTLLVFIFLPIIYAYTTVITVDSEPPKISILSPLNDTITGENATIITNITDNFGIKACWILYNNKTTYYNCKNTTIKLYYHKNVIYVFAQDLAGNIANKTLILLKDSIPPKIIEYGFYPKNNSLPADKYYFWIKVWDNYGVNKVVFKANNYTKVFNQNSTIYNVSIQLFEDKNYILWEVCDFSGLCTNLSFIYYIFNLKTPRISLKVLPTEVKKFESVYIQYKILDAQNATLIIVSPSRKTYKYNLTNFIGEITFKNTKEVGTYKVIVYAQYKNITKTKEDFFTVKEYSILIIKPLKKTFGVIKIISEKIKNEKNISDITSIKSKPGVYNLYLEAFNKTLRVYFENALLKDKNTLIIDKEYANNSIIYYIHPTFDYKKVNIYMSFKSLVKDLPSYVYKYLEVFKCKNYDPFKKTCKEKWEKINYQLDINNREVIYKSSSLSAFKIQLNKNLCLFNIKYPSVIVTNSSAIRFYVTIENKFCNKPFVIKILGSEKYNISDNYFKLKIGENKTILIEAEAFKDKIILVVNNLSVPISIKRIKEKYIKKGGLLVYPATITKVVRAGNNISYCIVVKNLEDTQKIKVVSSKFNSSFILEKNKEKRLCFREEFKDIGIYKDKIQIISKKDIITIPITIVVIPNEDYGISILVPAIVHSNQSFEGKIFVMYRAPLLTINICYEITKNNKIIKRKCALIRSKSSFEDYKLAEYNFKETLKDAGSYTIKASANIGGIYISNSKNIKVVEARDQDTFAIYSLILTVLAVSITFIVLKYLAA